MSCEQRPDKQQQCPSPVFQEATLVSIDLLPPSPLTELPDIDRFPNTMGYPVIFGGTEDKRDDNGWNWEFFESDPEEWMRTVYPSRMEKLSTVLDDADREALAKSPEDFFRKNLPFVDDTTIARLSEQTRLVQLVDEYERLCEGGSTPQQELNKLLEEIKARRNA